uniref:Uncharacterized protein n=1 Tax=Oryza rufipogon TaxID=4529 RepID=A0A0E0QXN4_ORYRU
MPPAFSTSGGSSFVVVGLAKRVHRRQPEVSDGARDGRILLEPHVSRRPTTVMRVPGLGSSSILMSFRASVVTHVGQQKSPRRILQYMRKHGRRKHHRRCTSPWTTCFCQSSNFAPQFSVGGVHRSVVHAGAPEHNIDVRLAGHYGGGVVRVIVGQGGGESDGVDVDDDGVLVAPAGVDAVAESCREGDTRAGAEVEQRVAARLGELGGEPAAREGAVESRDAGVGEEAGTVREGRRPRDKGEILWIDGSTTTDEEANLVSREDVGVLVMVGTGMG